YYRSDPWRGSWAGEGGGVLVNQAPHQLDLLLWYMGEVAEVFGYWANLNHPYIEVDDTAVAVVRFKSGALGNIVVSNSQNPGINARVSVHGANGASAGVQTDGGAMFIAGSTRIADAPFNDIWTIPGQESLLAQWKEEDAALFRSTDPMEHFHRLQVADFLRAVLAGRPPAVTAADGRRTVELFASIYRATRDGWPIPLPLPAQKRARSHATPRLLARPSGGRAHAFRDGRDQLSRPEQPVSGGNRRGRRPEARSGPPGHHLFRIRMDLCVLPDPGRVARGPDRPKDDVRLGLRTLVAGDRCSGIRQHVSGPSRAPPAARHVRGAGVPDMQQAGNRVVPGG